MGHNQPKARCLLTPAVWRSILTVGGDAETQHPHTSIRSKPTGVHHESPMPFSRGFPPGRSLGAGCASAGHGFSWHGWFGHGCSGHGWFGHGWFGHGRQSLPRHEHQFGWGGHAPGQRTVPSPESPAGGVRWHRPAKPSSLHRLATGKGHRTRAALDDRTAHQPAAGRESAGAGIAKSERPLSAAAGGRVRRRAASARSGQFGVGPAPEDVPWTPPGESGRGVGGRADGNTAGIGCLRIGSGLCGADGPL